jgi:hypothetical protein
LSQYTTVSTTGGGTIGSDALTVEPATTPAIPPNRVEKNPLRFSFSITILYHSIDTKSIF